MAKRIRDRRGKLRSEREKSRSRDRTREWFCKLTPEHKAAVREREKKWRENNPERYKEKRDAWSRTHRYRQYGITPEDYGEMLKRQNGRCAICGETGWTLLVVDHNHETGKVRELLCLGCNSGIGLLRDSIELVSSALTYLKRHL